MNAIKPFQANLINATILLILGLWGYLGVLSSGKYFSTALIPVFFGVVFLLASGPFKRDNKVVAHIIVLLTFLLCLALIRPLTSAINKGDNMALIRVGLMILSNLFALIIYIKSFIDARKAKAS